MLKVSIAVLAFVAISGCAGSGSQPAPTASASAPRAEPAPTQLAATPVYSSQASFIATPAVEAGFTHCCGDLQYKMEVDCGDRLKRCYLREGGEWKQTYGRHCKNALGASCYLHLCDDACSLN